MARKPGSSPTGSAPESDLADSLSTAVEWGRRHTGIVVVAAVVLVLVVTGLLYYQNYQSDLRLQATDEFERIQQTVVATGNMAEARTELQSFLTRFGDTPIADEARILLAEAQLNEEAPEEAIATLEPLTARLSGPLAVQGAFLQGAALEHAARVDEAESLYLRIAEESALDYQLRNALDHAARLRKDRGDYTGAAELYERILATFEGEDASPGTRQLYETRLAEVRAAARST